ncbi:uncharacterized protein CMU_039890 [Cryptosporidium muris RN66]|uniref:Uncharacterized protein n=1 Tax=Cryptosporidium muris (strain RN66) TaxID=441375 RepID=B6A9M9_CRYMR|nr:uncharacterized protein CMU_039890 [Cryptosporidium muris RN66]EEA04920.1 hypothetical protein CMU_039890 [Cryptosporidium muris RN66]|eukprot:XP_002139269.1 hypothetical protein [Cryptosporidium muris RN66]
MHKLSSGGSLLPPLQLDKIKNIYEDDLSIMEMNKLTPASKDDGNDIYSSDLESGKIGICNYTSSDTGSIPQEPQGSGANLVGNMNLSDINPRLSHSTLIPINWQYSVDEKQLVHSYSADINYVNYFGNNVQYSMYNNHNTDPNKSNINQRFSKIRRFSSIPKKFTDKIRNTLQSLIKSHNEEKLKDLNLGNNMTRDSLYDKKLTRLNGDSNNLNNNSSNNYKTKLEDVKSLSSIQDIQEQMTLDHLEEQLSIRSGTSSLNNLRKISTCNISDNIEGSIQNMEYVPYMIVQNPNYDIYPEIPLHNMKPFTSPSSSPNFFIPSPRTMEMISQDQHKGTFYLDETNKLVDKSDMDINLLYKYNIKDLKMDNKEMNNSGIQISNKTHIDPSSNDDMVIPTFGSNIQLESCKDIDFNQNKISDFSKKYIGPSIDTNMYIFTPREDKIGMNKKVDYLNFLKKEDFNNTEGPINKIKTKPSMNPNLFITTPKKPRNTEDENFKEFRSNKQIDLDVGICKNPKESDKPLQDTSIITDVNKNRTKDVLNISELPDINEKEYNSISDHNNTKIYLGPSSTPNLVIPTPRLGLEVEKEHINDRKEFLDSKNEIRSNKIIDQKKEMDIEDTNKDEDIETRVEDNKNNVSTSPLAFLKNIKPIVHSKKLKASNKQIINKNFNPNTIPILLEEKSPQLNSSSIHIGPSTDPFHCIITPRTYDKKQNEKDSEQNIDNLKYLYINKVSDKVSETPTLTSSIYEYTSIYNVNDNLKEKSINKIPEILNIFNSEIKGNSDVNIQQSMDSNKVIINPRELGINKSVSSEDKNNDNILLSIDNSKIYKEPLITPDIVIPNSEDKELDNIQLKKEIIGKQKDINSKIIEYPNIHIGPSLDTNMSIPTPKNFISSKQNVYKEPSTYIPKIYIGPSYTPNFFIRNFRGQLDNEIIEQGNSAINNKSQKQFDQMFVRPSTNPYLSILTPRKLSQVDKQLSSNIINLKNISDVELNSKSEENNSETKINLSDIENSQNKEEITNINKAIETNNISNRSNLLKLKAENSKSRKYQGIESNKLVFDDDCNKIEKKSDSVNAEADNKSLNPVSIDTNIKFPDYSRLKPTEIKEPGFFDIIQRAIFGNSEHNESKQEDSNKKLMKHKQIKIKPGIHLGVSCNPYFSFLPQNQSIKLDEVPEIVIDSEILLSNNKSVNNTTNFINNNEISAAENSSEVLKKENLDIKEPFNKKVLNIDKFRDLKYIKAIDNVETETREYSSKISSLLDNQKKGIDTSMSFKIHTGPSAAPNFAITTHIEKKKLTDEDLRALEVKISETDKTVKTDTKYDVLSSVLNPIVPCVTKAQYDHKLGELPEKINKVQGIIQKVYFGPSCTPNFAIPTLSHIEIPEESLKSIEIKTSDYFSLLVNKKPNLKISLNPLPLKNLEKNEDVTVAMNSKDHIFSKIIHKNSDLKNVTSPLNLRTLHSQATETFINDPKDLIRDDSKVQINTSLKSKSGIYIGPSTVPSMMIPTPRKLERDYSKDNMDNLVTKKKSLDFKPLIYKEQNQNDYSKDLNISKECLERPSIKENPDFCKAKRNSVILPTFSNLATKGIEKSNNSDEVSKTLINSDKDQKILFGPSDKIKSAYSETSKANTCGHMENTQAEEKQQNIEYPKLSEDKSRNTIIFDNSKLLVKDDKSNIAVDFKPENKFKKDLDTRMKILSHDSNTVLDYLRDETKIETLSNVNTKALTISEKSKRSLNLDEINRTNSKNIKKFLNKTEGELKYKEKLPSMKGDGNLSCNPSLATLTSKDHDEKKCLHEKKQNMIEKHKVILHNVEITDKEQVEPQRNVIQEYLINNRSSKSTINLPTSMQINSMYIGPSTDPNFIIPTPRKDSHNLASNLKLMKVSPGIYIGPSANPNFMFEAPRKQSPSIELYPINSIQRESPIAENLSFTHTPYGYCSFPIRDYVIPVYPNSELVNKEIYEPNLVHTLSYGGSITKSSFFEPFRSYTSPDGSFSAYKKIPIQTDTKAPMNNFVKLLSNNIDNLISNKPNIMETGKLCKGVQTKSTETLTDDSSIQSRRTKLILRKYKTMNCNLTNEVDNKSELNDPNIKDQFFPNKFEPLVKKKENSSRFQDFSSSSIVKSRKDFEKDEVRSQIKCLSCSKIKEIQDLGLESYPLNSNVLLKSSNIGSNSIKFSNVLSSNQSKLSALDILFSTDFSQPPHKQYEANKNNKLSISSNQEKNKVLNTIKRKNLNNLYIPIISKDYIKKMGNKYLNKNNFCYQGNTSTNINNRSTAVYNSFNNFPKNVVSLSNTTPYKDLNCNINLKPDKILTVSDIPIDNLFKECQTNGNSPNTLNNSQENRSLKTFQISNINSVVLNQTPTILTPLVTDSNPNRSPVSPQNLLPRKNIPKLDRFYDMYGIIRAKNKIRKRMNTTRTLKHRIESKKSRQLKSAKDNIMGESNKKLVKCKCHKCKKHLNIDPITLHIIKEEKRKQKELEKYKRTINNEKLKEYSKEKYKKLMNYFEHYIDHSNYACNICNCHTPVFGLPPFCFLPVNISDIPKIQSILENNHDEESNILQISVRDQGLRNSAESNHSQVPILIEPKDEKKPYIRQYLQLPSTKSKEIDRNKEKKELSDNSMSGVEIDYPSERPPTNLIPKSKVESIRNDSEHKLVQEENINSKKSPIVEDQNTSILSWFESWFSNNKTDLKSNEKSKISSKLRSQTKISLKNGYKKTAENLKINSKERKKLSLKKTTLAPMKVISIEKKEVADNDTKSIQNNLMNKYNDVSTDPIEDKTNTKLEIKENTKSDTFHEVLETPRLGMNSNTKIERSIFSIKHDILTEKGEEISPKIAQKGTTSKGVHNENKQITEFSVDSNPVVLRHSQGLVDKLVPSPEHSREVMTEMKSSIEPKNEPEHPKGDIINLDKKIYLRKIGQFIPEKKQDKVSKEDCNLNQTEVDYSKDSNELKENLISKEITNKDSRSNENLIESNTLKDSISKLEGNKEVSNNINVLDKAPALVSNVNTTPINTNNSSDLSTKVCVNTDENILSRQISNASVKKKQNSLKKVNVRKSIDKISRKQSLNQENQDVGYFTSWFSSWFSGGATQETNKLSNSKAQDNLVKDTKDVKNHKVVENIAIPTGNNETSIAKDTNKAVSTNEGLSNREADNKNISVNNIAAVSISSKNLALGEIIKGDFNDKKIISRTSNMSEKPEIPATLKSANNTNKEVTNEIVLEGISDQSKVSSKTIEPFIKSVEVTNINAPITTKNDLNKTGIFKEGATTKSSKEINKSGALKRSTSSTTESEPTSWFPGLFNESTSIISDINQTESVSRDLKSTEEIRSTVAVPASTEESTSWFSNWFETSKTENIDTNKSEIKTKNFKTSKNSLSTETSPVIENSTSWFSDWFGGYTNKSTPIKKSSHRTRSVKATIKKKGTDMKELQPKPKQIQKIVRNKTKSSIIPQSKVSASPPPPKISTKFNKEDSEIKSKSIKDQQYTQNNSWWYGSNTESNTSPADNSTPWFGGLFGTGEASDKTQTTVNNGQDNAVSSTDNSSTWYSGLFGGTTQPTVITDGEKNQVQGEISSASSSKSSEKKVVKTTISEQVSNPEPETATTSMWGWFGGTTATTQDSTVAVDKPQEQEGGGVSSSWYSAFGW